MANGEITVDGDAYIDDTVNDDDGDNNDNNDDDGSGAACSGCATAPTPGHAMLWLPLLALGLARRRS